MNSLNRAPIASPHDDLSLPSPPSPSTFAVDLGHFLLWGFGGQILFTVLELMIVSQTPGQSQAGASVARLMPIPVACAIAGVFAGRRWPIRPAAHPLVVVLLLLLMGALGLFNLFIFLLTGMVGYC